MYIIVEITIMVWVAFTISPGDVERVEMVIDGASASASGAEEITPGQHSVRCTAIGVNPGQLSYYTMTLTLGTVTTVSAPTEAMPDVTASVAAKARRFR